MTAIRLNKVRIQKISEIHEVDKTLSYKSQTLEFDNLLNKLYTTDFNEFIIQIEQHKLTKPIARFMLDALSQAKQAQNSLDEIKSKFKRKYGFTAPE